MNSLLFQNDKKRNTVRAGVLVATLGVIGCFAAAFTSAEKPANAAPVAVEQSR